MASTPVNLYIYDLSNGMAKQLSMQLTGRQIDGIWHTSVVVFGKEIFYGQGVDITHPGKSHHGPPHQTLSLGETEIDEETFTEYLEEMKEVYTADKYHLLEFNCNTFTNECVGFLTGGSIPDYIKDLPTDFLSTPFGAALRPTIDSMYRRPGAPAPAAIPPSASAAAPNPALTPAAASILQSVASQAQAPASTSPTPITLITSSQTLQTLLHAHRAVVVNFSDISTCPPCRAIAPVYEGFAGEYGRARFAKIDLSTPSGKALGAQWSVPVMPTFMFFLDGKRISELKGANSNELRSEIELLLFQAYPPHTHTTLSLPALKALSTSPILFSNVPVLDTVLAKLLSFVDSADWSGTQNKDEVKRVLSTSFIPYLKSRFATPPTPSAHTAPPTPTQAIISSWTHTTHTLLQTLPPSSLFPLVDMWRLAVLDAGMAKSLCSGVSNPNPITLFLSKATSPGAALPRPYVLTLLRLLSNTFSYPVLGTQLLLPNPPTSTGTGTKEMLTDVLVTSLLHSDLNVRTAGASLVFNVAAWVQKGRSKADGDGVEDGDWEMELMSAVVEAIDREGLEGSEDVVHRLTASLALLIYLSPSYDTELGPLLEVLKVKEILRSKLSQGVVKKKDVRRLIEEVTDKLCP